MFCFAGPGYVTSDLLLDASTAPPVARARLPGDRRELARWGAGHRLLGPRARRVHQPRRGAVSRDSPPSQSRRRAISTMSSSTALTVQGISLDGSLAQTATHSAVARRVSHGALAGDRSGARATDRVGS